MLSVLEPSATSFIFTCCFQKKKKEPGCRFSQFHLFCFSFCFSTVWLRRAECTGVGPPPHTLWLTDGLEFSLHPQSSHLAECSSIGRDVNLPVHSLSRQKIINSISFKLLIKEKCQTCPTRCSFNCYLTQWDLLFYFFFFFFLQQTHASEKFQVIVSGWDIALILFSSLSGENEKRNNCPKHCLLPEMVYEEMAYAPKGV